ncbi:MAG: DUF1320 family protein [Pirellulales bacterium]|nr:DUF1320 family protein [Pirellulales bacterium]
MSGYVTIEAAKPAALMARLLDENADAYQQADVSAMVYSVVLLGEPDESVETPLDGFTDVPLAVSEAIFDTLQTGGGWTADDVGYSFRHFFNVSPFTLPGRSYKAVYMLTTGTGAVLATLVVTTHPSAASDGYCVRADVENVFGAHNVRKWADVENHGNGAHIGGRIARAIAAATAEIDDRLRGGPYLVPIATVPTTIRQLAARLAGVWLYESRGIEDFDEVTGRAIHRLAWHREHVDRVLKEIMAGGRRLDAALASGVTGARAPVVVTQ